MLSRLTLLWFVLAAAAPPPDDPPQCNPEAMPMQAPYVTTYGSQFENDDPVPLS